MELTINHTFNRDIDLEKAVLGAIITYPEALNDCISFLKKPEVFYKAEHQTIYKSILEMKDRADKIDFMTLTAYLRQNKRLEEVGGAYYVTELTTMVQSSANIQQHAAYLFEFSVKRYMAEYSARLSIESQKPDTKPFQLMEEFKAKVDGIMGYIATSRNQTFKEAYMQRIDEIGNNTKEKKEITGVPCGVYSLDKFTAGWQSPDLIIVAARPGMGKTAFALQLLTYPAIHGNIPTAIFSLEMSTKQLVNRIIANQAKIPNFVIQKGLLSDHQYNKIIETSGKVYESPLHFDDTPAMSISEIRSKAYMLKQKHDIKLLIVDYLQLIQGIKSGSREQEISSISRGLKLITKELGVPVIALSQLNRAVETRGGDKRPQLSDLRDSGAIEQDADTVIFLYRPHYYEINGPNGETLENLIEINFAKHRNGSLGTKEIWCDLQYNEFKDMPADNYVELKPNF